MVQLQSRLPTIINRSSSPDLSSLRTDGAETKVHHLLIFPHRHNSLKIPTLQLSRLTGAVGIVQDSRNESFAEI
ncbi:hypothetical protein L2E82_35680 [Cichorium intybus]|uniref:Uncharacterized protein n=1 Tax=Cichorium intybus TaxID=13427 RepID=A0ACB9BPI6_CICIN|nr:hypothetical protein L2E82_35680 [Cichorium intybus]